MRDLWGAAWRALSLGALMSLPVLALIAAQGIR